MITYSIFQSSEVLENMSLPEAETYSILHQHGKRDMPTPTRKNSNFCL